MIFAIGEKVRYIGTTYSFMTGKECEVMDVDFDQNLNVTDYAIRMDGLSTIFIVNPTHIEAIKTEIPPVIPRWNVDKSAESYKSVQKCPHKNKVKSHIAGK